MTSDTGSSTGRAGSGVSRPPLVLIGVVIIGLFARIVWLDRLPGLDGDEAWYGVNIQIVRDGGTPFWRTPGTNPINPFHHLPIFLSSFILEPSAVSVRLPNVIWAILSIVGGFAWLRPTLGYRAAAIVVALLALSPPAIAHARFGWDPGAIPSVSLLVTGAALRGRVVLTGLSMIAAVMIHPSNVFLGPIVAALFAPRLIGWHGSLDEASRRRVRYGAIAAVVVGAPALLFVLDAMASNPKTVIPSIELVVSRAVTPAAWLESGSGLLRLFAGVSTIGDMVAPLSPVVVRWLDVIALVVLTLPLASSLRSRHHEQASQMRWLLAGIVVSFVALHLVGGPITLTTGRERYGLFLLVPMFVLTAWALDVQFPQRPRFAKGVLAIVAASFVAVTVGAYFVPLLRDGGNVRMGLRTGPVEPKEAAVAFMKADSRTAEVVQVMTDDWYVYWPVRLFAGTDPRFHVELKEGSNAPGGVRPPGSTPTPYPHPPDAIYSVVFEGSGEWRRFQAAGIRASFTAADPRGRPILHVVRGR